MTLRPSVLSQGPHSSADGRLLDDVRWGPLAGQGAGLRRWRRATRRYRPARSSPSRGTRGGRRTRRRPAVSMHSSNGKSSGTSFLAGNHFLAAFLAERPHGDAGPSRPRRCYRPGTVRRPMSASRIKAPAAWVVCRVLNTRWPVSDAWTAFSAVSRSRISPTRTTSGSWRRIARRLAAKVSPTFV